MLVRFHEVHGNLSKEVLDHFPPDMHYAAGEVVVPAVNFEKDEKPNLHYPHLFAHAKSLDIGPSQQLIEVVKRTPYVVFVGPSGSGRNTLIKHLAVEHPDEYAESLSVTTRGFRYSDGILEVQGGNYLHWTHEDVLTGIINGEFLEWEIIHDQQVSGMHIKSFESIPEGVTGLNDTELEGAEQLFLLDGRPSVFFVPGDFQTWIDKRIEGCSEQERISRLKSSICEFQAALDKPYFAYFINNISDAKEGTPEYAASLSKNGSELHQILRTLEDGGLECYRQEYEAYIDSARSMLTSHISRIKNLLG